MGISEKEASNGSMLMSDNNAQSELDYIYKICKIVQLDDVFINTLYILHQQNGWLNSIQAYSQNLTPLGCSTNKNVSLRVTHFFSLSETKSPASLHRLLQSLS